MSLNVIDLFCGCGGLSLGFTRAGFNVVGAYDCWDIALDCYNLNFDHKATNLDLSCVDEVIKTVKKKDFLMIIGGPPCQDFSSAGIRKENKRAELTKSFASIIAECRPKFFLMENVDPAKKSIAYLQAKEIFEHSGYGLTELSLDASYFGVPQRRRRFIVIGGLGEKQDFIRDIVLAKKTEFALTVKEKYPDFDVDYYYRHPRSYSRRGIFSIAEPSPTIRGVNRPIPSNYKFHRGDKTTGKDVRALTSFERALIQTFPKDYKWPTVSKQTLDQLIGNAVPVEFAKTLAQSIREYIEKEK